MNWKHTTLVFTPPPWPVFLTALASGLLVCELAFLLWRLWRGRGARSAVLATLALAGGPLTSLVAAVFGAGKGAGAAGPGRRALAKSSLWFSMLVLLAAGMFRWRLEGALAAITACAIAWAIRSYARASGNLGSIGKVVLLALRILPILLLGLWALSPQLEYPVTKKVRRAVLLGVDLSSSMQRRDVRGEPATRPGRDEPPPISRIESVQAALDAAAGDLNRLAEDADVHVFGFAATDRPLADLDGKSPVAIYLPRADGQATAIGDSAQSAADRALATGAELAGIVLISDGCNNTSETLTPEKFASRLAVLGVPVHTVGAGSDQVSPSTRSLSVQELDAPDQIEAFNRLPIRATVEAFGLQGKRIRVFYTFGVESNAPVGAPEANAVQFFTVTEARQSFPVSFVHVPLASGFHRLAVKAECENPPEGLSGQFVADKLVQVVDRGLRILYLEGVYRYEIKFLTQALAAAGRFSIDRRILLQPLRPDQPPPLGENEGDWLRYHAVILGDLGADQLTPKQHQILKDLVGKYGKGLCMIGGTRSFGRGGWGDTPLADVMPVDLKASGGQIEQELHVVPTADGLTDPIMAIGKEGQDVASAWRELSQLPGANRLVGVKPGAKVLAASEGGAPLLVGQRYGAGRALAIAFDTTWLWVTTKDTGELQRRFWRQVAFYLCEPKGNVWITTDKPRYDLARLSGGREAVEITAGVEDTQGSPMPEAPVRLMLSAPGGKATPLTLSAQGQRRVVKLTPLQVPTPGLYTLKLEADVAGKPLSAESRFEVQERDLEGLDVLANFKLLQRLADQTKGQFVRLPALRDLLDHIALSDAQPRVVTLPEHFDLGGHFRWPVILTILTLLCLEWAIRKRKGLV